MAEERRLCDCRRDDGYLSPQLTDVVRDSPILTVSLSSRRIFILEDVWSASSGGETIRETYPETACTTSMVAIWESYRNARLIGDSTSHESHDLLLCCSYEDDRRKGSGRLPCLSPVKASPADPYSGGVGKLQVYRLCNAANPFERPAYSLRRAIEFECFCEHGAYLVKAEGA